MLVTVCLLNHTAEPFNAIENLHNFFFFTVICTTSIWVEVDDNHVKKESPLYPTSTLTDCSRLLCSGIVKCSDHPYQVQLEVGICNGKNTFALIFRVKGKFHLPIFLNWQDKCRFF